MPVAVFGQLDHILRERKLTIADLKRQIEERYGLAVDDTVLDLLASNRRLERMDMTVVGAVASVLSVSLNDLLFVVEIPSSAANPPTKLNTLTEEETWRVWALLGMQEKRELSALERHELESITYAGSRRAREYLWRREAERRGVSFEDLREEIEEDERIVKALERRDWQDLDTHSERPDERTEQRRAPASR